MRFIALTCLLAACGSTPETPAPEAAAPADAPAAEEAAAPEAAPAAEAAANAAPAFELTDAEGNSHTLADLKGKVVVLEWFNPGCPFVVAAHENGPLTDMASKWGDKEVVWLAVNSGAPGKQGHGAEVNKQAAASWSISHPILLDETGEVGKAYGAKTTPQMVVIDPEGNIAYGGALDNAPMGAVKGDGDYTPYTANALDAVIAGEAAKPDQTSPWGCSVKYAS